MDVPELAYRVPFRLEREPIPNAYRLTNMSTEPLHGVSVTLHGPGVMSASIPSLLAPLDTLEVSVAGYDLARSTILVVRWFRPNDVEYLWRISF
jgi:hypothetical protein